VPVYEYRCDCGERFDVLAATGAPAPACPACGGDTRRAVSGFAVGGRADPGRARSQMPQTWKGTYGGNPEYVTGLRRQWERRRRLEDRYPELAGDTRPVVAHEGPYSAVPLRAGDPAVGGPAPAAPGGHAAAHSHVPSDSGTHPHAGAHGHDHGQPPPRSDAHGGPASP
jgi:putative FmdB family regulatory protein